MPASPQVRTPSIDPALDATQTLAPSAEGSGAQARPRPIDDDDRHDDRYQLIAEHGRGGLGRVVRAHDRYLDRTVAVKELLRTSELAERLFLREAMITARLEHPGIVPVHEAGRWANGDPYYVMKLVSGRTLKEVIAGAKTLGDRLALLPHLIAVADAVGYAHSEGVVHRDLKPANVIVGEFGETVVIDWGLARDLRAPDAPAPDAPPSSPPDLGSMPTVTGRIIGTPQYMAPEQARGEEVGPGGDVYALGAMLYELLAGRPPIEGQSAQALLDQVRAGPPTPLGRAATGVPRDLIAIVDQAMARVAAERYPSARELAADLKRFQTGQLVTAQRYGRWQLMRRWLVRHRTWVAMVTMALIASAAVAVGLVRQVIDDRRRADERRALAEAERARAVAGEHQLILAQARAAIASDPTTTAAWLKRYPVDAASAGMIAALVDEAEASGVAAQVWPIDDDARGVALSRDGRWVVAGTRDGFVVARDARSGTIRRLGDGAAPITTLVITPDRQAVITGDIQGRLVRIELTDGHTAELDRVAEPIAGMKIAANGALIVRSGVDVWRTRPGGQRAPLFAGATRLERLASSIEDRQAELAIAHGADGKVRLWRGDEGATVIATIPGMPARVAVTADGARALVATTTAVHWLDVTTGTSRAVIELPSEVNQVVIDPTQRRAAVVTKGEVVYVIELATGAVELERGHTDGVYTAAFDAKGDRMVTASDDGTVRVWDLPTGDVRELRGHKDDVTMAAITDDGRTVLSLSLDQTIRLWRLDDRMTRVVGRLDDVRHLVALDDHQVRVMSYGAGVRVSDLDLERGAITVRLDDPHALPSQGALTQDGVAWLTHGPRQVVRWRAGTSQDITLPPSAAGLAVGAGGQIIGVDLDGTVWSHDGSQARTIVRASPGTTVRATPGSPIAVLQDRTGFRVIDSATGALGATIARAALGVSETATAYPIASLGPVLVAGPPDLDDVGLRTWDPATGRVVTMQDSRNATGDVTASRDGRWLVAGIEARALRVWDARTGAVRTTLRGHRDATFDAAFSPDGERLATASYDHTVRVWDLATGDSRALSGHVGPVWAVVWLGAEHLASASSDGTVRRWSVPRHGTPDLERLRQRLATLTAATIERESPPQSPGA